MRNLIHRLREFWNDYRFSAAVEGWTPRRLECLAMFLHQLWLEEVCRVFGHVWYEEGYAGPDSGHTYLTCDRCGESHTTIMY